MGKQKSYLLILFFVMGSTIREVVSKLIMDYISPLTMAMITSFLAVISALLIYWIRKKLKPGFKENIVWNKAIILRLFLLSLSTGTAVYFGNVGINSIGPLPFKLVDVIVYPLSLSILAYILLGEAIQRKLVVATAITLFGFFIFNLNSFSTLSFSFVGIASAALSALSYAISLTFIKYLLSQGLAPEKIVASRFALLGVLAFSISPAAVFQLPNKILIYLLLLGIIGFGGLFILFFYGVRGVPATTMMVFSASTPLFSAVFSYLLIPGTTYSVLELIGLFVIMLGLLISVFYKDSGEKKRLSGRITFSHK